MLRVSDLVAGYGRTTILEGVSVEVQQGEVVALIGANGAGKTTLFRCLLGEYVHEGVVEIDGVNPRANRTIVLRDVAFVPQIAPRLDMPVAALMAYVAYVSGADMAAMVEVARRLGLDVATILRRPFSKLSGGMKQKLLIALALGRPARLLILDEPAANLDPAARATFLDMLHERARDTAMIISSHRIDEIAALVNRVVELERGKVVLDDAVSDAGALGSSFRVVMETSREEPAFLRSAGEWGLTRQGARWSGAIAGPERLRFLGFAARHSGLLKALRLEENGAEREKDHAARP